MRFIFTIHQIIAYSAKKDRALSSGCVRVEKSDQLASILLQEAGWSEDKKRNVLEVRKQRLRAFVQMILYSYIM